MRVGSLSPLLLAAAGLVSAASWSFADGSVTISGKNHPGGSHTLKLQPSKPLTEKVTLEAGDRLKLQLTSTEGGKGKRAHQVFFSLTDAATGLAESWPLEVKPDGKGKLELASKDIPTQLLTATGPLNAGITVASFGTSTPHTSVIFHTSPRSDATAAESSPLRYGAQPLIHHTFRADPSSPPAIISLVFTAGVLAAIPLLLGVWRALGANLDHLPQALSTAPASHAVFFGAIVALEGIFFLYYTSWNLGRTLPAAAVVGAVAFLSGSRALSEVQERRLSGNR